MTILRVKELREAAGISKAELAKRALLNEKTVRKIEGGTHQPSLTTAMKIAAALGVPLTELIAEEATL